MKFARIELIFVIAIVSVVVTYFHHDSPPTKDASPVAQFTPRLISQGEAVPSFVLSDPSGNDVVYQAGQGPILVVLTATGCGGCLARIDGTDREAYNKAKALDISVWNMLVYQGADNATGFVDQHLPSADLVLCDPKAEVSVSTLGGSDATCWLLIDKEGKLAWRGPAEPEALAKALENL